MIKRNNFVLLASLALVLTAFVGNAAFAQERVEEIANVEAASSVEAANYNNTRSNRSSIAAPDTNECDGVTCLDGSCTATSDMCPAVEGEVVEGNTPDRSPADDSASVAPAQDYNATRSNKPGSVNGDGGDCDDTDERCTPGAAEPDNTRCDPVDEDCDGDGLDDGQRAQDYNSSRSNKPNTAANPADNLDDDDDGDGLPTEASVRAAAQGQLFESYRNEVGRTGTKALKKGDRLSTTEAEPDSDQEPGFTRFSDITGEVRVDEETGRRELSLVAVAAQDVRNWSNSDREAFKRLQAAVASNTPEQASIRIAQQVLENEKIEKIEATQTEVRLNYRAEMRLFGLIPVEREVEGRAQTNGTVEIDYPWYRFLSTTPDTPDIENQLQTSIEIMMTLTADPI
jgi:hypothetical protein